MNKIALGLQAMGAGFTGRDPGVVLARAREQEDRAARKEKIAGLLERMNISGPERGLIASMPVDMATQYMANMMQQQRAQRASGSAAAAKSAREAEDLRQRQEQWQALTGGGAAQPNPMAPNMGVEVAPDARPAVGAMPAPMQNPSFSADVPLSFGDTAPEPVAPMTDYERYSRALDQAYLAPPGTYDTGVIKALEDRVEYFKPAEQEGADFDTEKDLRKEFTGLPTVKAFSDVNDAFQRVKASAEDPSAAGDMAMIFNYMKMLDPGSTVREGEFATAQQAGGVGSRILATYNQLVSGERLSPEQREDFLNRAGRLYNAQAGTRNQAAERYRGLASEYGISADRVARVVDLFDLDPEDAAILASSTGIGLSPNEPGLLPPSGEGGVDLAFDDLVSGGAPENVLTDRIQGAIDQLSAQQEKTFTRIRTDEGKLAYLKRIGVLK